MSEDPRPPEWQAETDDITGPASRVHMTHPVLGEMYGHTWPSPVGAHQDAARLRTELAGMGWEIEVVEA